MVHGTMKIDVHHLARVEGHGNIHIRVKKGKLVESRWEVVETPRFFEVMLKGMSHELAPFLTARICGICSIGHALASLRAVERAMGVKLPKAAETLRLLAKHGETLQSHALHVFLLGAPDFFNVDSVIPMIESHPEVVGIAVRLKKLGNDLCDLTAGRTTHPVSLVAGGVSKMPEKKALEAMRARIEERLADIRAAVDFFKTLELPDFVRETEFVALKGSKGRYPWIGGDLVSTDGVKNREDDYRAMTNEYVVDFSTSKFTRLSRESMAVGALARVNNNFKFLKKDARKAARSLGLEPVNHNPFMNHAAQLVECYQVMLEAIELIDELLSIKKPVLRARYKVRAGVGVSAVEVPRGILYHEYEVGKDGKIKKANCIIPTTQNHANIHHDLPALVKQEVRRGRNDKQIELLSEMLVRSYDPCISCSVH